MPNWKILITFTYPHEAYIIKGRLESEGIKVEIRDELTAQVNNFYSNAIGGVKLLVQEEDYSQAYNILIESGQIKKSEESENKFLIGFNKLTTKIPWFGKLVFELRFIIIVALIVAAFVTPFAIYSIPSKLDLLTRRYWCVDMILQDKIEVDLKAGIVSIQGFSDCKHTMAFRDNGTVNFPEINSFKSIAFWELRNDSVIITQLELMKHYEFDENLISTNLESDSSKCFYCGEYALEISRDQILLTSENIVIMASSENPRKLFRW
ncbi:MAG TPA: DUF2007 domain-containing protein [Bacteroidales bacterium]|nr:DUF2007 domain-containing protein [Bacteroidales bacterium]HRX97273.1 DUF2007 domain-containing protein [Bacteroidales bacterium]